MSPTNNGSAVEHRHTVLGLSTHSQGQLLKDLSCIGPSGPALDKWLESKWLEPKNGTEWIDDAFSFTTAVLQGNGLLLGSLNGPCHHTFDECHILCLILCLIVF